MKDDAMALKCWSIFKLAPVDELTFCSSGARKENLISSKMIEVGKRGYS